MIPLKQQSVSISDIEYKLYLFLKVTQRKLVLPGLTVMEKVHVAVFELASVKM